jgi:alanyl-tRNA synthetase
MSITHLQLRKLFSDFWKSKDHAWVPPIPLIPQNDPTTLFTGSGMQQLVPYLLGEPHPLGKKLYNIQPCIRSQDIEEVGDNRHDTFFEMMGNWSLGTYFKKEQLAWCWDFLTNKLKLPKEKLYVSVFKGTKDLPEDTESYEVWKSLGVPEEKIFKYDPEKNWWSRAGVPENMPAGEPGGPDSEVFYEFTHVKHDPKYGKECHPNCDCGRFMEIGNSVFMQYKKNKNGTFAELPNKNVDFGGGLERILTACNNDPDIFSTDVFFPILQSLERYLKKSYKDEFDKSAMRVIADHIKTAVFLIVAGVRPSNKEQGYILRRLLRRAAVKMQFLSSQSVNPDDFSVVCQEVLTIYDGVYFHKDKDFRVIQPVIEEEISRFNKNLDRGLKEIEKIEKVDGKIAFDLYQTYGFPLEITEELFKEKGQQIDKKQFGEEFEKHKDLSRTASAGKFKGGLADHSEQTLKYHTATHLLHQALFDVLGNDIRQEGSNITVERLRFDFYSPQKPEQSQIKQIEDIVNTKIKESLPLSFKMMPKDEALKIGARAFFREKYPDTVKVYFIGDYSKEFCGGPHIKNTKEIGAISIYKLEKIGSNLYRIYAR